MSLEAEISVQELKEELSCLLDFFVSIEELSKTEELQRSCNEKGLSESVVSEFLKVITRAKFLKEFFDAISFDDEINLRFIRYIVGRTRNFRKYKDFYSFQFESIGLYGIYLSLFDTIKLPDLKGK